MSIPAYSTAELSGGFSVSSGPHNGRAFSATEDSAERALMVLHRRWAIRILTVLGSRELHFLALQRQLPGIAHKVLTEHLRFLEERRVVSRNLALRGPRVMYGLTERGKGLLAVIGAMREWGDVQSLEP